MKFRAVIFLILHCSLLQQNSLFHTEIIRAMTKFLQWICTHQLGSNFILMNDTVKIYVLSCVISLDSSLSFPIVSFLHLLPSPITPRCSPLCFVHVPLSSASLCLSVYCAFLSCHALILCYTFCCHLSIYFRVLVE